MSEIKTYIGIISVVLTILGYIPYISDIFKGKTKPHTYSWLLWSIMSFIIYALQVSSGAGAGAWITLCVGIMVAFVFVLSLKKGTKDVKPIDLVFLIMALLTIPLWLIAEQPVLSIIILIIIDLLAFLPTIRKSWNDPFSETLSMNIISCFRHALSVFALAKYNIVTMLFPVSWTIANALFALLLIVRRRKIGKY